MDFENKDVNANVEIKVLNHAVISSVSSPFISMVSHFVPNLHQSSQKPDEVVPLKPVETHENKYENIELEEKEEGFIGPRLPRLMTDEEFKALMRELFPNSEKYK